MGAGAEPGSSLTAYAIFVRQDNPAHSLTRIRLVDFQSLGDDEELLHPLVCCALERCRQEGIHMLEAIGFPPEQTESHRPSFPSLAEA